MKIYFKKDWKKISNSKGSIDNVVQWCFDNIKSDYKIVRCLQKKILEVRNEQKVVLFYVLHELVLKTSKQKLINLNKRLGKSILIILPYLKGCVPFPKIEKCMKIWFKWHVFEKEINNRICKVVKYELGEKVKEHGHCEKNLGNSSNLGIVSEPEQDIQTCTENKKLEDEENARRTPLNIRLHRDFGIPLEELSPSGNSVD